MARMRNRIQSGSSNASMRKRKGLILTVIVLGILTMAWFDGGEEPIHPISHEIRIAGAE